MTVKNSLFVPADTSPEVWRMQMSALGAMTPEQRLDLWEESQRQFSLMEDTAMRRLHPDFSDFRILVELVRARYGDELASKVVDISANASVD
ncbi:MAG: hypothetical protein ACKOQU_12785 [Acidimicrobiaceae bacterium]